MDLFQNINGQVTATINAEETTNTLCKFNGIHDIIIMVQGQLISFLENVATGNLIATERNQNNNNIKYLFMTGLN